MEQWKDFDRSEQLALKRDLESQLEAVSCPKCSSTWFEQVKCFQFKADHNLILGQEVPTTKTSSVGFVLLRCLRCSNLLEPKILYGSRDILHGAYEHLLDTMDGLGDSRKKEEKKNENDSKK